MKAPVLKTISSIILFSCFLLSKSQNTEIRFEQSFPEAFLKAKKESKLLFVDYYTVWCGPCKELDRTTFKSKAVVDFFNRNFVSVKVDYEDTAWKKVSTDYPTFCFPTLLFIDTNGKVEHRLVGYIDSSALLAEAKKAIKRENTFSAFNEKVNFIKDWYNKTKQIDVDTLAVVIDQLRNYCISDSVLKNIYFSRVKPEQLHYENHWKLLKSNLDIDHPFFQYITENKFAFTKYYDSLEVEALIDEILLFGLYKWIERAKNEEDLELLIKKLKIIKPASYNDSGVIWFKLYYYEQKKDWESYLKIVEENQSELLKSEIWNLNMICNFIIEHSSVSKHHLIARKFEEKILIDNFQEEIDWLCEGEVDKLFKKHSSTIFTENDKMLLQKNFSNDIYPLMITYLKTLLKLNHRKEAKVYAKKALKFAEIYEKDKNEIKELFK